MKKSFLFLLVLFLTGCSYHIVKLSILQPAEYLISPDVKKISIYPAAGLPDPPGIFDSISKLRLDPEFDYNTIKLAFVYGIHDVLSQSPRFEKVTITDTTLASAISTGAISRDLIRRICAHDSTDAVLLLKKVVAHDEIGFYVDGNYYSGYYSPSYKRGSIDASNEIDNRNPLSNCTFHFRIITNFKWALYQPNMEYEPNIFDISDSSNYFRPGACTKYNNYKSIHELLYNSCFYTGNELGRRITPSWDDDVKRYVYTGMSRDMAVAMQFMNVNQWSEAGELWTKLSESPNKRVAYKASYNTALVWEEMDDLDQALTWIEYADSLRSTSKSKQYKKIILERLQKRSLLDLQLKF